MKTFLKTWARGIASTILIISMVTGSLSLSGLQAENPSSVVSSTSLLAETEAPPITLAKVLCMLQERHMVLEYRRESQYEQFLEEYEKACINPDAGLGAHNFFIMAQMDFVYDQVEADYSKPAELLVWPKVEGTQLSAYPTEEELQQISLVERLKLINFAGKTLDGIKIEYLNIEKIDAGETSQISLSGYVNYDQYSMPSIRISTVAEHDTALLLLGKNLQNLKYIFWPCVMETCFFGSSFTMWDEETAKSEWKGLPRDIPDHFVQECPYLRSAIGNQCSPGKNMLEGGEVDTELVRHFVSFLGLPPHYYSEANSVVGDPSLSMEVQQSEGKIYDMFPQGDISGGRRTFCYSLGSVSGNVYLFCKNSYHPPGRGAYASQENETFPYALDAFTGYRSFAFSKKAEASGKVILGDPNGNYMRNHYMSTCKGHGTSWLTLYVLNYLGTYGLFFGDVRENGLSSGYYPRYENYDGEIVASANQRSSDWLTQFSTYRLDYESILEPRLTYKLSETQLAAIAYRTGYLGVWNASAQDVKFQLQLGAGINDHIADARLIITDYDTNQFYDLLEFVGDRSRYEMIYDFKGEDIPKYRPRLWGELDDTMNPAWWKPRLRQVRGRDFLVDIVKNTDFSMTVNLYAGTDFGAKNEKGFYTPPATTLRSFTITNPNGKPQESSAPDTYIPNTDILKMFVDGQELTWVCAKQTPYNQPQTIEYTFARKAQGSTQAIQTDYTRLLYNYGQESQLNKATRCELTCKQTLDGATVHDSFGVYYGSPWKENPTPQRITDYAATGNRITTFVYDEELVDGVSVPIWLSSLTAKGGTAPNYRSTHETGLLTYVGNGYSNETSNEISYSYTGSKLTITTKNLGYTVSEVEWDYANLLNPACTAEGETTRYNFRNIIAGGQNRPLAAVISPDGVVTTCRYALNGGSVTTQVQRGSGSGATRSTVTYNPQGYLASAQTIEVGSSLTLDSSTTSEFTAWGAPKTIELLGGKKITYTYDGQGRLENSKLTWGNLPEQTSSFTYDTLNRIKTATHNGRKETHNYGGLSHTVTYPLNYTATQTWDIWGQPLTSRNTFEPAMSTTWARTAGQPPKVTTTETESGRTWIDDYDAAGNCIKQTSTACQGLQITPQGTTTIYTPLADGGTPLAAAATTYNYDLLGRIKQINAPNGTVTDYTYHNGHLATVTAPVGDTRSTVSYKYDSLGRLESLTQAGRAATRYAYSCIGGKLVTTITDPENNIHTSIATPDGTFQSTTSFGETVTRSLNLNANQLITQSRDGHNVVTLDPDWSWKNIKLTSPSGHTLAETTRTTDTLGRTSATQTLALGRTTQTTYDAYGLPTNIAPSGVASIGLGYNRGAIFTATATQGGATTRSTWDAQRRYTGTTGYGAPGTTWNHTLSTAGAQTNLQTAASATQWNTAASGTSSSKSIASTTPETATYYPGGALRQVTLSNGTKIDYNYDGHGELFQIQYTGGPGVLTTPSVTIDPRDGLGRIKTTTDASGTRAINYSADQIAGETYTSGLLSGYGLSRTWDNGLQTGLTLTGPGGLSETITYAYDGNRNPSTVTNGTQQGGVAIGSTGLLEAMRAPHVIHAASYTNAQLKNWTSGSLGYAYDHDGLGRRTKETLQDGTAWNFAYTETNEGYAGQLKSATLQGTTTVPGGAFTYAYNGMGVRQNMNRSGFGGTASGNNLNQIATVALDRKIPVWGQVTETAIISKAGIGILDSTKPVTCFQSTTGALTTGEVATYVARLPYAGHWRIKLYWRTGQRAHARITQECENISTTQIVDQSLNNGNPTEGNPGKIFVFDTNGPALARIMIEGSDEHPDRGEAWLIQEGDDSIPPNSGDAYAYSAEGVNWKTYEPRSLEQTNGWFYAAMVLPTAAGDNPGLAHVWVRSQTTKPGGGYEYHHSALLFPYGPATTTYGYDANGQQNADWRWDYHWQADGRLGKLTTSQSARNAGFANETLTYTYDAEGRRVAREHQVNGALQRKTLWIYDGFLPLYEKETNATGGDLTERVYVWSPTAHASGGATGLLWYREKTGTTTKVRSPLYDGRGNVVGLVDGNTGQQVSRYYYGPFGEPIGRRGEPVNLGFATHYTDPVSGLVDFGQRWYNPTTGHWLSREPLGEAASSNLYAYCNNDPVNYLDYLGLDRRSSEHTYDHRFFSSFEGTPAICAFGYTREEQEALDQVEFQLRMDGLAWRERAALEGSLPIQAMRFLPFMESAYQMELGNEKDGWLMFGIETAMLGLPYAKNGLSAGMHMGFNSGISLSSRLKIKYSSLVNRLTNIGIESPNAMLLLAKDTAFEAAIQRGLLKDALPINFSKIAIIERSANTHARVLGNKNIGHGLATMGTRSAKQIAATERAVGFTDDIAILKSIRRYTERLVQGKVTSSNPAIMLEVKDIQALIANGNFRRAGSAFHELNFRFATEAQGRGFLRNLNIDRTIATPGGFLKSRRPDYLFNGGGIYDIKPFKSSANAYDLTRQFLDIHGATGNMPVPLYYRLW
ncbi:MAG: hypothetical protein LBV12_01470 [Puniceicoccales bacterium]|jgi:RHS repeat-associated protein|nr:hypothetical protein [Puniceicoccales bacterium]